jgi:ABC-type lipoprotein export system ATPase subunit
LAETILDDCIMIQFEGVHKHYRTANGEVRALNGVTLAIDDGEYVAVQGHSGSGKSTLLALAGGLALPTEGLVAVGGDEVSAMPSAARARFRAEHVGFVFQLFHLLPYLNIVDNVRIAALDPHSSQAKHDAEALLDKFGLHERKTHRPAQLSAGERQRVAMARALLNGPKLLLADEPTGNLDPENAKSVLDAIDGFHAAGGTVLLVTHHAEAAGRAARIISLSSGQVVDATAECT